MKTKEEIKAKKQRIKEKLAIRQVWKTTPKEKKGATWEFELFKKIALDRAIDYFGRKAVLAKHIWEREWVKIRYFVSWLPEPEDWIFAWFKYIFLEDLTPTNFSHTIPKSRWEEYRLDPSNIEIVSRAWHHYEHTKQILKVDYPN